MTLLSCEILPATRIMLQACFGKPPEISGAEELGRQGRDVRCRRRCPEKAPPKDKDIVVALPASCGSRERNHGQQVVKVLAEGALPTAA